MLVLELVGSHRLIVQQRPAPTQTTATPRRDTVVVGVPDSMRAEVRVTDTVRTRSVGINGDSIANIILTIALVGVTAYYARKAHRLNEQVAREQKEHAKDVVRLERDHREFDERREADQRRRVRIRVSGVAYALRRQIRSWVDEAPSDVQAIVQIREGFKGTVDPDELTEGLLTSGMRSVAMQWAQRFGREPLDRAEARVQRLLEDARDVDNETAEAIRRVFVRFYDATGRLNRLATSYHPGDVASAHSGIQACIALLDTVVGVEFLDVE